MEQVLGYERNIQRILTNEVENKSYEHLPHTLLNLCLPDLANNSEGYKQTKSLSEKHGKKLHENQKERPSE